MRSFLWFSSLKGYTLTCRPPAGWSPTFTERKIHYPHTSPGRPAKLTSSQKQRLREVVTAGPEAAGYQTGCWSSALLQDLIHREFGQLYNVHYLSELLRNLGFSYQKARFVSDHLNEEKCQEWLRDTWPALVQLARRRGACCSLAMKQALRSGAH